MKTLKKIRSKDGRKFLALVEFGPGDYEVTLWDWDVNDGWATSLKFMSLDKAFTAYHQIECKEF